MLRLEGAWRFREAGADVFTRRAGHANCSQATRWPAAHQGVAAARNLGLQNAAGDLIARYDYGLGLVSQTGTS